MKDPKTKIINFDPDPDMETRLINKEKTILQQIKVLDEYRLLIGQLKKESYEQRVEIRELKKAQLNEV